MLLHLQGALRRLAKCGGVQEVLRAPHDRGSVGAWAFAMHAIYRLLPFPLPAADAEPVVSPRPPWHAWTEPCWLDSAE